MLKYNRYGADCSGGNEYAGALCILEVAQLRLLLSNQANQTHLCSLL